MFVPEDGLPDDHLRYDHNCINYPIRRREILFSIIIISTTCLTLLTLTTIFLFSFAKKQESSFSIKDNIKPTFIKAGIKIIAGQKFGDTSDSIFDDSSMENFTSSYHVSGIIIRLTSQSVGWIQCFYSSDNHPKNIIQGVTHGRRDPTDVGEQFSLDQDEKISKVQIKLDYVQLYLEGHPSIKPRIIVALRFFTTKGRSSPTIDQIKGDDLTEEFEGYTLGYVTGSNGRYIDQLQFYWYQTRNN